MTTRFWVVMTVFAAVAVVMIWSALHFSGKFGSAFGVVVDAATGQGVANADVELFAVFPAQSGGSKMTLQKTQKTKPDGAFVFPATVGGSYRLTVTCEGYTTLTREGVVIEQEAKKDLGRFEITKAPPFLPAK